MRKSVIEPSNEITITPSMGPPVASQKSVFSGMITPSMGPPVALRKIGKWGILKKKKIIETIKWKMKRIFILQN